LGDPHTTTMLQVQVEVMGYTLDPDLQNRRIEFKLRTPWKRGVSHDFENKKVTLVVTQEEFDHHKIQQLQLGDRPGLLLFLEVWSSEDNLNVSFHDGVGDSVIRNSTKPRMAGLARCNLYDQLKDHNLSPSIQWLKIHDPVRNSDRGKILIRVGTTFGDFRIRHVEDTDDAKPTKMKSKLNPSEKIGHGGQQAPQKNCPPRQSQSQPPQSQIPKSVTSIPSQSDPTTTFVNSTRKTGSNQSTSTCLRTSDTVIGNTAATITGSRSGTASSGSSTRSRRIAADIYRD